MGALYGVFDCVPPEDLPAGYDKLRVKMKLLAMSIKNRQEAAKQRIQTYSGLQNISVENINKNNKNRFDAYDDFIELLYPYLDFEKKPEDVQGTMQDLVEEYKKIFNNRKPEN